MLSREMRYLVMQSLRDKRATHKLLSFGMSDDIDGQNVHTTADI